MARATARGSNVLEVRVEQVVHVHVDDLQTALTPFAKDDKILSERLGDSLTVSSGPRTMQMRKPIHPSAWKGCSPKSGYENLHGPGTKRRFRPSPRGKKHGSRHKMLWPRINIRGPA